MRRMLRGDCLLTTLLGLLICAGAAQAQTSAAPSDADRDRAREAYDRGRGLFRRGDFAGAETAFEAAYAIIPNAIVLLSVGEARERAGNIAGAVEAFEQYVRDRPGAPDAATVRTRVNELRTRPATLHVTSAPPGASIRIDGQLRGETTPTDLSLPAGMHRIEVSLAGYEPATTQVELAIGGTHGADLLLRRTPTPAVTPHAVASPVTPPPDSDEDEDEDREEDENGGSRTGLGFWIASGVAVAAVAGGTLLAFQAKAKQTDFNENPSNDTADDGERFALFADVGFGVAAAAAITAVVLYATADDGEEDEERPIDDASRQPRPQARISPYLAPNSAGVNVAVQF